MAGSAVSTSSSSARTPRPASDWFTLLLTRALGPGGDEIAERLFGQTRGEESHQLGLLLVEGLEA